MKSTVIRILAAGAVLLVALISVFGQTMEEITKEKILGAGQEWQEKYDKYDPAADMVDALKPKVGPDVKIDVYLGLWCPDSRNNVPPFIKLIDRLATKPAVRYFTVPKKANKDIKYFVEDLQVERVPTFIFHMNGKEIGRIIENPKIGMIEDIMEIFFR